MQSFYLLLPSGWEIFVILFVILLLFGGRKIPELMRGLGRGIREFKNATNKLNDEDENESEKEAEPKAVESKVKSND